MEVEQRMTKRRKTGLFRLMEIAGTKKWWLLGSMTLSVAATVAQCAPFVIVYLVITELSRHAADLAGVDRDYVFTLGFMSLAAVMAYGILAYTSNMLSHIAAFNILYEIRVQLSNKLSRLSMGYFTKKATGKIKKIMSEDVEEIEVFIAHHIPDLTSAILFPLLVFGYLFYLDWRLALVSMVPFPAAILIQSWMFSSPAAKETYRSYHTALENMNATVIEYVRGMPVVKIFNQSADAFERLKNDIDSFRNFTKAYTRDFSYIYPGFLTILSSSLVFIIPAATFLLTRTPSYEDFLPMVFLFMLLGGGMFFPLFKLMWISGLLTKITVGLDRIDDILDMPELQESEKNAVPRHASVEFRNVTFAYDDTPVLHDISFTAEQNKVTALVGPSGAGKTTIALLCARFWDIQSGEIVIGDVNIRDMNYDALMDHVSFVFQDGFMFFDSIEENIRMGNRTAKREAVIEAAKAAQCHEFIVKLPQGYDTLVGEGGIYLSGGEQQRIGLARAILKDSPIVVLDEATAYADPENEGKILVSLAKLIEGKTVIIVAHRLSTVIRADTILVVDKGTIVERGTHDHLLSLHGLYADMWDTYSASRTWTITAKGDR